MSHVFDLKDDGDEDYLSFDFPGDSSGGRDSPPPSRSAPVPRGRPPKRSPPPRRPLPPLPDDIFERDIPDSSEKNRKIPLKQAGEHQQLMNTLNAYAGSERFSPLLDKCGIKLKDLGSKTVAELKELRERVRACCANAGGGGHMVAMGMLGVCSTVETVTPKKLADMTGYRSAVERNPEFHSLAEMIALDSGFLTSMSPIQRMVMCLGMTAAEVAAANGLKLKAKVASSGLIESLKAQEAAQKPAPTPVIAVSASENHVKAPVQSMYD